MSENSKNLDQSIIERLKLLPIDKKQEVFDFIKSIER